MLGRGGHRGGLAGRRGLRTLPTAAGFTAVGGRTPGDALVLLASESALPAGVGLPGRSGLRTLAVQPGRIVPLGDLPALADVHVTARAQLGQPARRRLLRGVGALRGYGVDGLGRRTRGCATALRRLPARPGSSPGAVGVGSPGRGSGRLVPGTQEAPSQYRMYPGMDGSG